MARDVSAERERALEGALSLFQHTFPKDKGKARIATEAVLESAEDIFRWLVGPVSFVFTRGPLVSQDSGSESGPVPEGSPVQLHDNEQFDLSVAVSDAKGAEIIDDPSITTDDLTWTVDNDSVVTLQVSTDTRTCTVVAGTPGSAVVTVTAGSISATEAVDVVAGQAALITITEGAATPQGTPA